ncbi:MAG TPA: hypothetical protein VKT76_14470 [Bradyrhizobium sp.]|nr:hypothetical protein [Bradyrhizobium sp.]
MTVHHHPLTRGQARFNQRLTLLDGGDAQRPQFDRGVRLDDISIVAVGAGLHCGGRDDRAAVRRDPQPRIDELARPQPLILVWEDGLETRGARGLVDLIVNEFEVTLAELDLVVLIVANTARRPFRIASVISGKNCWGRVKITEMGLSCVMTTNPLESVGWTMLP